MDKALRVFVCFCAVCVLCLSTKTDAHAYVVGDSLTDSSVLECFRGILSGCNFFDDYVAFRVDETHYVMIIGDIENEDSFFTWKNATEYIITSGSTGYLYGINYTVADSVDVSDYIVYSNLGDYPLLEERGDLYEMLTFFTLCASVIALLVRPIFKFTLRTR